MSVIIILLMLSVTINFILFFCLWAGSVNENDRLEQSLDMQKVLDDLNETIQEHQEYIYSKMERTLENIKNQSSSTSHKH